MKLIHIILLTFCIALIPHSSLAKKAETIDELVSMPMYDISKCALCHKDKYEEWKDSTMGNSVTDPRILRGWRTFIKLELDQEETLSRKDLTICLNCHVPQIRYATPELVVHIADLVVTSVEEKDDSKREAAKKELSKLNLNCLGCHNLKAMGFDGEPEDKVIYGPRDVDESTHEGLGFKTRKSEFMTKSDFCAQCHHCPPSVPWEDCPTLYTTYIEGFIEKGRSETCQDCHMKGEERVHKFFGPEDPDFLESAISLDIKARPTKYIDMYEAKFVPALVLEVSLKNNAGHVLPHG